MLVFGGNTHNDTSHSFGAKCYSAEVLTYDVLCHSWDRMNVNRDLHADLARFGHSTVVFEDSLYIYGGFDGQMLNDMLKVLGLVINQENRFKTRSLQFTPGNCQSFNSSNSCLSARPGVKCVWNEKSNLCLSVMRVPKEVLREDSPLKQCPEKNRSSIQERIRDNLEKCQHMEVISCV